MNKNNLFENLPETCTAEIFETLFENKNLKLERIVSDGQVTPPGQWYDQGWDEWVVLLQGNAGILFEEDNALAVLKSGDYLFVPTHKRHRVEWTDPKQKTIWLAIHIKEYAGKARRAGKARKVVKSKKVEIRR